MFFGLLKVLDGLSLLIIYDCQSCGDDTVINISFVTSFLVDNGSKVSQEVQEGD